MGSLRLHCVPVLAVAAYVTVQLSPEVYQHKSVQMPSAISTHQAVIVGAPHNELQQQAAAATAAETHTELCHYSTAAPAVATQ
eukprot:14966-Heterococcus_DN1.PRE.7